MNSDTIIWGILFFLTTSSLSCMNQYEYKLDDKDRKIYCSEYYLRDGVVVETASKESAPNEIIFIHFDKTKSEILIDDSFVSGVAKHIAMLKTEKADRLLKKTKKVKHKIKVHCIKVNYDEAKTFRLVEDFETPGAGFLIFLNKIIRTPGKENIIIFTSGSAFKALAYATHQSTFPNSSVHSIIGINANPYYGIFRNKIEVNYEKISHRFYNFYTGNGYSLDFCHSYYPGNLSKGVNVGCSYVNNASNITNVDKTYFTKENLNKIIKILHDVDKTYEVNNDLLTIFYKEKYFHTKVLTSGEQVIIKADVNPVFTKELPVTVINEPWIMDENNLVKKDWKCAAKVSAEAKKHLEEKLASEKLASDPYLRMSKEIWEGVAEKRKKELPYEKFFVQVFN